MDNELRWNIHRTTSLLARRIVAEVSKRGFSGETIVRFNSEADNELLALVERIREECKLAQLEANEFIRKDERRKILEWIAKYRSETTREFIGFTLTMAEWKAKLEGRDATITAKDGTRYKNIGSYIDSGT